jgi:Zn-dependent M28 family amino/carboxypeptidase
MKIYFAIAVSLLAITAHSQQTPTPAAAAPWWSYTTALSSDEMQGRDTGTAAYQQAADYVAARFQADGLKPAGDNGSWFQQVPMHQVELDTAHSSAELVDSAGAYTPLAFLYDITLAPRAGLPAHLEGDLVFLGYGEIPPAMDLNGKIAVYFNSTPAALPPAERAAFAATRARKLADSGVIATVAIDNPAAIEPSHWPAAYARSVTLRGGSQRPQQNGPLALRIAAESAAKLFAGTSQDAARILDDAEKGLPIPTTRLERRLRLSLAVTGKDISSPNIIAVLPGSDPTLKSEYVAVSAHLDGYGYGTPVLGDNLYNGALDDAAYVATLLELADKLHAHPPARSLLICIFTGEEKGLLGSVYYTQHLTVPKDKIVADLNLDQLRPIFPLKILTMEGIADSTLGDTAKLVAARFSIELRPDRETERRLFSRSDNFSFVRIGVPIASFIFGYDPGTESERIYRDWYARRYHKPQDDLLTPIDWEAAVKFNDFYRALALAIANNPTRPTWLPTSAYAPKTGPKAE